MASDTFLRIWPGIRLSQLISIMEKDTTTSAVGLMDSSSEPYEILTQLGKTLGLVTGFLCLLVGVLKLDFLPATLLGSAIVGFNFLATRRMFRLITVGQSLKGKLSLLYCLKLGVSMAVLYAAISWYHMPPLGILIGVSNILIAVTIYTLFQKN